MNVMLDLETMGTNPDSVILSIGAVAFNKSGIIERFEVFCDTNGQRNRTQNHDTLKWWLGQSEGARNAMTRGMSEALPFVQALINISTFIKSRGENVKVWGNGSDFDNAMLSHAFSSMNISTPWKFWNNRCYRTVKAICNDIPEDKRAGVYHSAVDDAAHQANHLIKIAEVYHVASII